MNKYLNIYIISLVVVRHFFGRVQIVICKGSVFLHFKIGRCQKCLLNRKAFFVILVFLIRKYVIKQYIFRTLAGGNTYYFLVLLTHVPLTFVIIKPEYIQFFDHFNS